MAISIQGVLYSVGMNTSGMEKGAAKVSDIRQKMAKDYEAYTKKREKYEKDIEKAVTRRKQAETNLQKAEKRLSDLRESGADEKAITKQAANVERLKDKVEELTEAEKKLDEVRRKNNEDYLKAFDDTTKALNSQESALNSLIATGDKVNGAFMKISVPLTAIAGVGLAAWSRQESAIKLMETALRSNGLSVDEYSQKFQNLASNIQRFTTIGDEAILENEKLALSMGIPAEKMDEFQRGAVGFARMTGKDLPEASRTLAKAMHGNFEALQELIPEIKNATTEEEKLAILNARLAMGWEIAKAEADTFSGALQQAKNAVGDSAEAIGKELEPVAVSLLKRIKELAEWFSGLNETNRTFIVSVAATAAAIPALTKAAIGLAKGFQLVKAGITAATTATKGFKMAVASTGIGILMVGLGQAVAYALEKWSDWSESTEEAGEASEDAAPKVEVLTQKVKEQAGEIEKADGAVSAYYNALKELSAIESERAFGKMSEAEQMAELAKRIDNARERITLLKGDLETGGLSIEHMAFAQGELVKWTRELYSAEDKLESLRSNVAKREADAARAAADRMKKEQEDARRKADEEAKRTAERQRQLLEARREFELNLKIETLQKSGREREAEAIKNALRRNELMEKYGYDIEQATRALKAQKELESGGKVEYSKKDIEKAQRIVERGEGGTVGKNTLAQAQAILEGRKIEGQEMAVFSGASGRAKSGVNMNFAKLPEASQKTAQGKTAVQAVKTEAAAKQKKEDESAVKLDEILKGINAMTEVLKEAFS